MTAPYHRSNICYNQLSYMLCKLRAWHMLYLRRGAVIRCVSARIPSDYSSNVAGEFWNGTNGGEINGGVSQKNAATCKIGRICAKLAGFARNLREICANLRNLFLQTLRKFARNLRPRLLRYRLLLSEGLCRGDFGPPQSARLRSRATSACGEARKPSM